MARVKRAVHSKKRRRTVLERAQGFYGNKSRSYRAANEQVMHSLQYAYRDRRARKGDFRKLWIQRINAAARLNGTTYSRFIAGLHRADVEWTARCSPTSPFVTRRPSRPSVEHLPWRRSTRTRIAAEREREDASTKQPPRLDVDVER